MNATTYRIRPLAELPFYCDPVYLFVASWALMLGSLEIQVSETTYPDRSMGIVLFLISLLAMLAGVGAVRLANYAEKTSALSLAYRIDASLLRKINWILFGIASVIVVFNWVSVGPAPVLGFFGAETSVYAEYGRFKQVLFPVAMALSLNSSLEESAVRRWLWRCFSSGTLLAYVARGPILIAVVQALVLYSIRTSASKRKIYIRAGVAIVIALVAMDIVGENRTAQESFFQALEIKEDFRNWPMAIVWPISYISIPISNLCWIVKGAHFNEPTVSFLYPVLPSFWAPASPHEAAVSDSHIVDGTHTYLANYFLDFSWAGIVGCNFLIGLLGGFLTHRERISRQFMTSPIILSAFSFIFFWDFFVSLPTIIELCVQALIQRLCITPVGMRERPAAQG
jgi:hypothetical protein